eukprot:1217038-Ditylum_brightwellii.AAC.1
MYKDDELEEDEELADDISCLSMNDDYSYDTVTTSYRSHAGGRDIPKSYCRDSSQQRYYGPTSIVMPYLLDLWWDSHFFGFWETLS